MTFTVVHPNDKLPLTCSRKGTCCHGNSVYLNPWEIAVLANNKKCSTFEFISNYTVESGIRLRFEGPKNQFEKSACLLYNNSIGCSIHEDRPLACRLFPLGRQLQNNEVKYIFQGEQFPCLKECNEVLQLPYLSVSEYLKDQKTNLFEIAQDEYLEVMQNLADIAFTLLLDTGLSESGDKLTLQEWRKMKHETTEELKNRFSNDWYQSLLSPNITLDKNNPSAFITLHNELLQTKAQNLFEGLTTIKDFSNTSIEIMALALFLAKGIGADPSSLIEFWIDIAKENGALE